MKLKKCLCICFCVICLFSLFTACSGGGSDEIVDNTLSFAQSNSVEAMKKLDGQQVKIIGYMSTLSPINGEFMYLMNLPYQNCPFCVPNTTELSNTMAVYAPSGKSFEYTDRAIQVTGTLNFGDYTDEFGYVYNYRIIDASYTEVDTTQMSEKLHLWQQLASTDVVSEIYSMYEYVNFLCFWPSYKASFGEGEDYLYPSDALAFIETEGAQFNYGYQPNYFEDIIATVRSVDPEKFNDLIDNIRKAQALADKALTALKNEEYTLTEEYSGVFSDGRSQYKMNAHDQLSREMDDVYYEFADWLAQWEL